jgi:Shikimate dehydrogenase substrate binding domain
VRRGSGERAPWCPTLASTMPIVKVYHARELMLFEKALRLRCLTRLKPRDSKIRARINMFNRLSGATRLFPIIGDPIKYVESPMRLTRTFGARDYNGICVPMQVPADDLDTVMAGLTASRNVDGILVTMPHKFTAFAHCATSSERAKMLGL